MNTTIVRENKDGIEYLKCRIQTKQSVYTEVILWKIPRNEGSAEFGLKLGRYKLETDGFLFQEFSNPSPKSLLTLDNEEFSGFISFLQQVYEPFTAGIKSFIPVEKNNSVGLDYIKKVLSDNASTEVLKIILDNNIIPNDLLVSLESVRRKAIVDEFRQMLDCKEVFDLYKSDKSIKQDEAVWQKFFTDNPWLLGHECVDIIDERRIDSANIDDFILKAHDGFVDLVEIKRSNGIQVWAKDKDHGNCVPSVDLVKSITQCSKYLYEIERESNSQKFSESVGNIKTVKPRITLIIGRSKEWDKDAKEAFRILNASYHSLYVLTYDHVLERAIRNNCFS